MSKGKNDFSMQVSGMTVNMKSFAPEYTKWLKPVQRRTKAAAREVARLWAEQVIAKAKMYCPVFGTDLGNSIASDYTRLVAFGSFGASRISVKVGVKSDWRSTMDEMNPPWGVSSPQIAVVLHEMWESVAKDAARERAAEKSSYFGGVYVGEKFLARAAEDATQGASKMAKAVFRDALTMKGYTAPKGVKGKRAEATQSRYNVAGVTQGLEAELKAQADRYAGFAARFAQSADDMVF